MKMLRKEIGIEARKLVIVVFLCNNKLIYNDSYLFSALTKMVGGDLNDMILD